MYGPQIMQKPLTEKNISHAVRMKTMSISVMSCDYNMIPLIQAIMSICT